MLVPQQLFKFIYGVRFPSAPPNRKSPRNLF
nr:MAG TPA: hypothetical protein [Caudoviricetes sp.]